MVKYYCDKCKKTIKGKPKWGCYLSFRSMPNKDDVASWLLSDFPIAHYCYCKQCHNEFVKPLKKAVAIINKYSNYEDYELTLKNKGV